MPFVPETQNIPESPAPLATRPVQHTIHLSGVPYEYPGRPMNGRNERCSDS